MKYLTDKNGTLIGTIDECDTEKIFIKTKYLYFFANVVDSIPEGIFVPEMEAIMDEEDGHYVMVSSYGMGK